MRMALVSASPRAPLDEGARRATPGSPLRSSARFRAAAAGSRAGAAARPRRRCRRRRSRSRRGTSRRRAGESGEPPASAARSALTSAASTMPLSFVSPHWHLSPIPSGGPPATLPASAWSVFVANGQLSRSLVNESKSPFRVVDERGELRAAAVAQRARGRERVGERVAGVRFQVSTLPAAAGPPGPGSKAPQAGVAIGAPSVAKLVQAVCMASDKQGVSRVGGHDDLRESRGVAEHVEELRAVERAEPRTSVTG